MKKFNLYKNQSLETINEKLKKNKDWQKSIEKNNK
jgi:hypothetical protein